MGDQFNCGIMFGIISAGILGIIFSKIRETRTKMGARNRPLDTFPDAAQPKLTAAKIVGGSIFSMFSCAFWWIVLLVMLYILVHVYNLLSVYF